MQGWKIRPRLTFDEQVGCALSEGEVEDFSTFITPVVCKDRDNLHTYLSAFPYGNPARRDTVRYNFNEVIENYFWQLKFIYVYSIHLQLIYDKSMYWKINILIYCTHTNSCSLCSLYHSIQCIIDSLILISIDINKVPIITWHWCKKWAEKALGTYI